MIPRTMVVSVIECDDIIYEGICQIIDKLYYTGLRICENCNNRSIKEEYIDCNMSKLEVRRNVHLLLFINKQSD